MNRIVSTLLSKLLLELGSDRDLLSMRNLWFVRPRLHIFTLSLALYVNHRSTMAFANFMLGG